MYDIMIREFGPRRMAAIQHIGDYCEIGPAIDEVSQRLERLGLSEKGPILAAHLDDPEQVPTEKLRSFGGYTVPDEFEIPAPMIDFKLVGGRYVVLQFAGSHDRLENAYQFLREEWLPESGETRRDAPSYELYRTDPRSTEAEDLVTLICVPLE